jgi:hypothetical protein
MNIRLNFPKISQLARNIGREVERIHDKRAVVERFRKEIDKNCGPGIGEKLIRSVGGYEHFQSAAQ